MVDKIKGKYISESPEPVSLKVTEKIIMQMKSNSVCKIINNGIGTGFFVKIPYKSQLLPVLIASNYIINQDDIKTNKKISLYLNNDKIIIKLDNTRLIYTNEKLDITIIEIKENENNLNINYLELDDEVINYFKNKKKSLYDLNNLYINESIYLLNYSKDKDIFVSYGNLLDINNSNLIHNCKTKGDLAGSPILLLNKQKLIGINCSISREKKYNKGMLLIYSIIEFSKIKNKLLIIDKEGKNINHIMNFIIGELNIKEEEKDIRIINSYEEYCRDNKTTIDKKYENEKEIKDSCEIRINGKLIPFSYFHKFNKKGKYSIVYIFKNNITKTNQMFCHCSSLININLIYFNTINITNISAMFRGCYSLVNINLSNFNTDNVIDMSDMFSGCSSLTNINLSNFNTNNVINMSWMFNGCSTLTNINLSNFDTKNVIDMNNMFYRCSSLTEINLFNFNTDNVTDMSYMFSGCSSLTNISLFNFNTDNVNDMHSMFSGCSSLTNINLSNFNNNVANLTGMFDGCKKLNKNKIITINKKILKEFDNKKDNSILLNFV